jgi:hypothetical protein
MIPVAGQHKRFASRVLVTSQTGLTRQISAGKSPLMST